MVSTMSASSPVLAQIQVLGLERTPATRVREMIEAREWAPYPADAKSRDIAALLGSGLFTAVSVREVALSSSAVRLDIQLTEGAREPAYRAPEADRPRPKPGLEEAARILGAAEPDEIPRSPWVIGELDIEGNRNVKRNTIRSQIKARKGDLYERAELDRDIQAVLSLGSFDRVAADITVLRDRRVPPHFESASPSPHPIRLAFLIEEKPLVRKIEFAGRKEMSKGRLYEAIELEKKDPFDRVKLRSDTEKVLEAYRKKGFHRARIESDVRIDTATLKADVVFRIEEGPKAKIGAVRFTGVSGFKPKKLAKKMKNRRRKVYAPKELPEDLKKVEEYYKNRGYLDFRVLSSSVSFNEDSTRIFVHVAVDEGRQYRFGDTTFGGHAIYASTDLAKALDYRRKKLFSQERFDLSIRGIQELYAEKGRLRAQVVPTRTFNPKDGLMDVHFEIAEGPIVYVDHVDVEGYKATKGYVFKRELVIKPGMPFQMSKIRKSQERIINLGFIDDVQLDVQSPYDPDKVDLTFEVFEGKPGMLTAGAGFSSLDGMLGTLSLQHLNLFGRAWRTKASWSFGARVNDYSLSWTTPWVRNKPISLGFDVFNTRRISQFEGSSSAFVNKRTGGSVHVGPRFQDDKYQLSFRYSFQNITISNVDPEFLDTLSEGTSVQSSISVEGARDTRDNIWDPTKGTRNSIGAALSGGPLFGDINILKPFVSSSYHKTLFSVGGYPLVMTLANRASYVTQFSETREVPVYERFFIGGQDTLRGYSAAGEAGYRDGGKIYDVANIEFGFPLARERRRTIVKFVTFFDAGGSWDSTRSMRLRVGQDQRDIKTDVGFGIRFVTPAFPIRLDWGYGFQHRPGESNYQINFGIGNLF
ncbi:MAG: outer membrane protein assembly factor BamA [Elusimicrobiota bacterium]